MSDARNAALLFGGFWLAIGLWSFVAPARFIAAIQRFPRHKLIGWILSVVVVCWASYKLYYFPMEFYVRIRNYVAVLTPVYLYGLIVCLPDLLAARMGSCFMLLCCEPLLDSIRWQETPLRLVIVVMAYALILACMFIAVSPFKFRHWTTPIFAGESRTRLTGGLLACYGGIVLLIGLLSFS